MFFSFAITLGLFPSVITAIQTSTEGSSNRIYKDLFVPFNILVFTVGDLLGRLLGGKWQIIPARGMPFFVFCRILFFFLFLCCPVLFFDGAGNAIPNTMPKFITNDPAVWCIILIFGFTSGFSLSTLMIFGPKIVDIPQKETASTILVFALYIGLLVGVLVAFLIRGLLCKCDPFLL